MAEWCVELDDLTAVTQLRESLELGPMLTANGQRSLNEQQVGKMFHGLRVEVFSDEHPPPHFRVRYQGETARFRIDDCSPMDAGLRKFQRNIERWHAENKALLIETWNSSRPTDCPVGAFRTKP